MMIAPSPRRRWPWAGSTCDDRSRTAAARGCEYEYRAPVYLYWGCTLYTVHCTRPRSRAQSTRVLTLTLTRRAQRSGPWSTVHGVVVVVVGVRVRCGVWWSVVRGPWIECGMLNECCYYKSEVWLFIIILHTELLSAVVVPCSAGPCCCRCRAVL